jgi:hypothetical protein
MPAAAGRGDKAGKAQELMQRNENSADEAQTVSRKQILTSRRRAMSKMHRNPAHLVPQGVRWLVRCVCL